MKWRWRRDVDEAERREHKLSAHRRQHIDTDANVSSTHATIRPRTATTSLSAVSTTTQLPDGHDRPLAVEPAGRRLPSEMRKNPLQGVGAFMILVTTTRTTAVQLQLASRPTQPSIPPGSVNEYQLRLGRKRQVCFTISVQVKR